MPDESQRTLSLRMSYCTFVVIGCAATLALGQSCYIPEHYDVVPAPFVPAQDEYAAVIATDGEWLFVGAPKDDQLQTDAGAVHVFRLLSGTWIYHQKLIASGGVGPAEFGRAIAIDGDTAIIGAERDRELSDLYDPGAAYVFRLEDTTWTQTQKLFSFGPGQVHRFGHSVGVQDGVAVIGCITVNNDVITSKGAAFVFHDISGTYVPTQRITADVPTPGDAFGRGVTVDQGQILVTSHGYDQPFTNAGAIFVFEYLSEWVQVQRFNVEGAAASSGLGTTFAARDGTIITGNPNAASQGIAHFFDRTPFGWFYSQTFTPLGVGGVMFGSSVSVRDGKALVGGPNERFWAAYGGDHAGAAYFYTKQNHAWKLQRRLNLYWPDNEFDYGPYECWAAGPQPLGWYNQFAASLGSAVVVSDAGLIAASDRLITVCWDPQVTQDQRVVNVFPFDTSVQDCNANSTADHCEEFDCNGNDVPDGCDLSALSSIDCNMNSVPDECDAGFRYALDNETPYIAWFASPSAGYADFIWLNQYRVKPGGQFITHIALAKTPYIPLNAPVTVLLYDDPTNDGDPSDAVLLATAETRAMILDKDLLIEWAYVPIPHTFVGQPGDHFFVGAVVRPPYLGWNDYMKWSVPLSASGPVQMGRSWRALVPPGAADIDDLTNNPSPITLHQPSPTSGPYMIRAVGSDCNGNGMLDACDIQSGISADANSNGIPDECETHACLLADIAPQKGDSEINVLDLLQAIDHWGACVPCFAICAGDVNDDCIVNVADLMAIIQSWGACPKP